ncbi:MAG: hypothetical protein R6U20_06465 [Longimonas sp.]|uniref:hypothetical protein n=1 Tax=Longimonas sp. TaxID=2039626 RepID=UPI003976D395
MDTPPDAPSNGPAPDSPFNTSPSEGFEGSFPPPNASSESSTGNPFDPPPASVQDDWSTMTIPASIAVDMARDWVRERQTATLLGAFAAGVFVGVLSR